ncbi:uncharacterized protein LOC131638870 [Vicia villosa]|uniref:uncharacterized protein LOC131638870 n=1 Tax=Vicia villosa TaxID=3911 RepID=UPI00273C6B4D|nr:uncharacterized protein LOC131638870 [Vicia villosa]
MQAVTTVTYQFSINGKITRKTKDLKDLPEFKFHSKCENLNLIDLSFTDDLLLFLRGDKQSVQMMMERFNSFSKSTGLYVNPAKCKAYYGGISDSDMQQIEEIIGFHKGKDLKTKKSHIAGERVCAPQSKGGLNIINMYAWNKACMVRLLWNLCKKKYSMWVRWVHMYYVKEDNVMEMNIKDSFSWIFKRIINLRGQMHGLRQWDVMMQMEKFKMKAFYCDFLEHTSNVVWIGLLFGNSVRPRAKISL